MVTSKRINSPTSGDGVMVNSGEYNGMDSNACKLKIISDSREKQRW